MRNKEFVLPEFRELSFNPINTSYYDAKIKNIKINLNEEVIQPIQNFNINHDLSQILSFNVKEYKIPKFEISCDDMDNQYNIYDLNKNFQEQSISNINSNNYHKRQKFLTKRSKWNSIDLEVYEQKIKI